MANEAHGTKVDQVQNWRKLTVLSFTPLSSTQYNIEDSL